MHLRHRARSVKISTDEKMVLSAKVSSSSGLEHVTFNSLVEKCL